MAATTLDDVWFPLIKKKGLSKKPVAAQASMSSDLSARYKIIPRSNQVKQAMEVSDQSGRPVADRCCYDSPTWVNYCW